MSESPKSEKCQTRYSTPAPELDDHRFQAESLPRPDETIEMASRRNTSSLLEPRLDALDRPSIRTDDNMLDVGPIYRDFEQAIVDGDSVGDVDRRSQRRMSVSPAAIRPGGPRHSCTPQDQQARSRASSTSSRSSSPPNSVEAFAEPRRRERANTIDSHAPSNLDVALHRTASSTTQPRRPTFSNASATRPENLDPRVNLPEADVCFPAFEEPKKTSVIDYEELEEFVALSKKANPKNTQSSRRKHSLTSQSKQSRFFPDLRPQASKPAAPQIVMRPSTPEYSSSENVTPKVDDVENAVDEKDNEKKLLDMLQNENEPSRFGFFSSEFQSTIHACELGDLVLPGDSFRDLFQLGNNGGVWWLDVLNPTNDELGALARAFSIHPLTAEDIITQEAREKVEIFKQYYFVCFRTFYQLDKSSERYLEPVNIYMVVFREGVLSFSYTENNHASNVRRRIGRLREYVSLSSDWICYAMM